MVHVVMTVLGAVGLAFVLPASPAGAAAPSATRTRAKVIRWVNGDTLGDRSQPNQTDRGGRFRRSAAAVRAGRRKTSEELDSSGEHRPAGQSEEPSALVVS